MIIRFVDRDTFQAWQAVYHEALAAMDTLRQALIRPLALDARARIAEGAHGLIEAMRGNAEACRKDPALATFAAELDALCAEAVKLTQPPEASERG